MTTPPYAEYDRRELILRDHLALDRTSLANERTLMAFVRTGLNFVLLGLAGAHFGGQGALGVVGMAIGVLVLIFGAWRFIAMRRKIAQAGSSMQPIPPLPAPPVAKA